MLSEVPICQKCRREFSSTVEPLLLPDCGHSICQDCVQNSIQSNLVIKCAEDGIISLKRTQLSDFPKNFALMQLIKVKNQNKKKTSPFQSSSKLQMQFVEDYKNSEEYSSASEHNYLSTNTETTKCKLNREISNNSLNARHFNDQKQFESETSELLSTHQNESEKSVDRCSLHKKKLEILCLKDKQKICSNCALFGSHKNHEVMTIEDAAYQINQKIESLNWIYTQVENAQKAILDEKSFQEIIQSQYQKNLGQLLTQINIIFTKKKEIEQSVIQKKSKIIQEIKKKVKHLEEASRRYLSDMAADVLRKADLWKLSTSSKFTYISEQIENRELAIDLITLDQPDIIAIGNQLIKEIEDMKQQILNKMQDLGTTHISIDYKGGFDYLLDQMFYLDLKSFANQQQLKSPKSYKSEISSQSFMKAINNDQTNNEISLLKDINNSSLQLNNFFL